MTGGVNDPSPTHMLRNGRSVLNMINLLLLSFILI